MQNNLTNQAVETNKTANPVLDWILRAIKGFVIGFGAITPGLSGGLLMVVLGIYEPLMRFLGNIKDKLERFRKI